jgi:hypothetical protein
MVAIVGYSPYKSQDMVLIGGLTKTCADYKNGFFIRILLLIRCLSCIRTWVLLTFEKFLNCCIVTTILH